MDTFPAGHQMSSLQRGVCAGQEERREGLNPTALVPWNEEDGADISEGVWCFSWMLHCAGAGWRGLFGFVLLCKFQEPMCIKKSTVLAFKVPHFSDKTQPLNST